MCFFDHARAPSASNIFFQVGDNVIRDDTRSSNVSNISLERFASWPCLHPRGVSRKVHGVLFFLINYDEWVKKNKERWKTYEVGNSLQSRRRVGGLASRFLPPLRFSLAFHPPCHVFDVSSNKVMYKHDRPVSTKRDERAYNWVNSWIVYLFIIIFFVKENKIFRYHEVIANDAGECTPAAHDQAGNNIYWNYKKKRVLEDATEDHLASCRLIPSISFVNTRLQEFFSHQRDFFQRDILFSLFFFLGEWWMRSETLARPSAIWSFGASGGALYFFK